ncbi:MAG: hypothetical protein ACMUIA_02500 [bacterium]
MQISIDESKLKQLFKEALIEALEERKDIFHDLITEALEDVAMIRAIQEGEKIEPVSKKEILNILEG